MKSASLTYCCWAQNSIKVGHCFYRPWIAILIELQLLHERACATMSVWRHSANDDAVWHAAAKPVTSLASLGRPLVSGSVSPGTGGWRRDATPDFSCSHVVPLLSPLPSVAATVYRNRLHSSHFIDYWQWHRVNVWLPVNLVTIWMVSAKFARCVWTQRYIII